MLNSYRSYAFADQLLLPHKCPLMERMAPLASPETDIMFDSQTPTPWQTIDGMHMAELPGVHLNYALLEKAPDADKQC